MPCAVIIGSVLLHVASEMKQRLCDVQVQRGFFYGGEGSWTSLYGPAIRWNIDFKEKSVCELLGFFLLINVYVTGKESDSWVCFNIEFFNVHTIMYITY